jgi:xanthine dehydrogenase accessory factor
VKDIYSTIIDSLKSGKSSVLATIIKQGGSSSRGPGAKMLIMEDGSIKGSVGGGILEKAVIEASSSVFLSLSPMIFRSSPEMACGGNVEVFLAPFSKVDQTCLETLKNAAEISTGGGSVILATALDARLWQGGRIAVASLKSSGETTGFLHNMEDAVKTLSSQVRYLLDLRKPEIILCCDNEGNKFSLLAEPIISNPVLYVFGAGHVSSEVVPLAGRVGFKVVVIDDRPEFLKAVYFQDAEQVFLYNYDDVMKNFSIDDCSFIVIATRSHSCDEEVLGQALHTYARYIGMIGSRRKIATIFGNLKNHGFTEQDLSRVHSPIGLDIGAETPQEIALSIVAELVKVRAEKLL